MTLTITINTDNAAFEDDMRGELARILRKLAKDFEQGNNPTTIRDINGNTVGTVKGK
jgi:hypothetical protein